MSPPYLDLITFYRYAFLLFFTGKKTLPDPQYLAERFLLRKKFVPDPQKTNMMFAFFAQHFTHQFFKTDESRGPEFTKGLGHGVSTNLYLNWFSRMVLNKIIHHST